MLLIHDGISVEIKFEANFIVLRPQSHHQTFLKTSSVAEVYGIRSERRLRLSRHFGTTEYRPIRTRNCVVFF